MGLWERKDWEQGCIDFNWTRRDKIQKKNFFCLGGMAQHIGRVPFMKEGVQLSLKEGDCLKMRDMCRQLHDIAVTGGFLVISGPMESCKHYFQAHNQIMCLNVPPFSRQNA